MIARRLVQDQMNAISGLENMTITKELMASARAAKKKPLWLSGFTAGKTAKQKAVAKEREKEVAELRNESS